MSGSKTPARRVQQLALDGTITVVEIYGERGRTRTNAIHCKSRAEADAYLKAAQRFAGGETVRFTDGPLPPARPRAPRARGRAA